MFGFSIFKVFFTLSLVFVVLWVFKIIHINKVHKAKKYKNINANMCDLCGVFFSDTDTKICNRIDCPGN